MHVYRDEKREIFEPLREKDWYTGTGLGCDCGNAGVGWNCRARMAESEPEKLAS